MIYEKVYIAIITTKQYYDTTSWNDVITFFNTKYPLNGLIIETYFVDFSEIQIIDSIKNFVEKYPIGKRAIIANYSSVNIVSTTYCQNNNLDILHISPGANSNIIKSLHNILTYAPYNQYSILSFFQFFVDFQMREIKILYEQNNPSSSFYKTVLDEIVKQADLLKIKYTISNLEKGVNTYDIKPKSAIYILSDPEQLKNIYITDEFLKNIPKKCFIALTESYYNDIFKNIPALVFMPFPINYTTTTKEVYDSIKDKRLIYFTIFTLFDILFVLNSFTTTNLPLDKANYIDIDLYSDTIVPASLFNNYIDSKINGAPYGKYQILFTKNVIIGNDIDLYLKNYRGGQLSLPDSYSICKNIGITPNNPSLIEYDECDYYKIYRNWELFIVKFNSNITEISVINNLNVGSKENTKFIYEYTSDGYFKSLQRLVPMNKSELPKVNLTMSKVPIKLYYLN